jgi:hypothetical protein
MLKRSLLATLFCFGLTASPANSQNPCPSGTQSDKVACVIPQVYGVNGLDATNPNASGQFSANFLTDKLRPVLSSVAMQSALLPLASPSSGIIFSWDAAAKVFTSSTDSFGPILGERAETIGKHRVYLGFSYQYFKFSELDGVSLKSTPIVLTQPDDSTTVAGITCSINAPPTSPQNTGDCGFIRDVIDTKNRMDLKVNQFTTFVTFGLTNRLDVSMAIPIETVSMNFASNATIVHNDSPSRSFHAFPNCPGPTDVCFQKVFSNGQSASGIGDITFRVKGTMWKGERAAFGLGVDVRAPTGDQLNFLGAGAAGFQPFVVWSYRSRISPHVLVGYQVNGSSLVGGDISTGTKDRLPGELTYSGGADFWITKRITAAFDIIGQEVFQARRTTSVPYQDLGQCQDGNGNFCDPNTEPKPPNHYHTLSLVSPQSFNISNASIGVKVKPVSSLLITGNVLIKLNNGGLRSNLVPLIGISYAF